MPALSRVQRLTSCLLAVVMLAAIPVLPIEASSTPTYTSSPPITGVQNLNDLFTMPYLLYPSFQTPEPPPESETPPSGELPPLLLTPPITPTAPETLPDPRYVPVPPPDPELMEAEGDVQRPEAADLTAVQSDWPLIPLVTAADCTAETDLRVYKTVNGTPRPGYEIEYRIQYWNDGNAAARDVRITDTLPVSATYVSDVPGKGFTTVITTGGEVVWTRPFLNPGESGTHILRVRVDEMAPVGGSLVNVVQAATSDVDVDPSDDIYTQTTTIQAATRDMEVQKSLYFYSGQLAPGSAVVYQLRFRNAGTLPARDVFLTDTLPVSMTFVSWSSSTSEPSHQFLSRVITESVDGNQIVWPLGEVPAGWWNSIYLTARVNDEPGIVGSVQTNTLTISTSDVEVETTDNVAVLAQTVQAGSWDVRVDKSLYSGIPIPGNKIIYQVGILNSGSAAARDVVLTDTLPPTVTFVSWSSNSWSESHILYGREIVAITSPHQVVWFLGDVPPSWWGNYIYLTARIAETATVGSILTNTAAITTTHPDSSPANDVAILSTAVTSPTRDVHIEKYLQSGTPIPGAQVQYLLYFSNEGNSTARAVTITDTLPEGVTFVSWKGDGYNPSYVDLDQTVTLQQVDGQLVWPLGDIVPGGYGYIYLTVRISPTATVGSVLTNTATVATSDLETDYSDNAAFRATTVASPTRDVRIEKYLQSGTPVPGLHIRYLLYFRNEGNATARAVLITDTLPEGATFVAWEGYGYNPDYVDLDQTVALQQVDGQLVWPLGDVVAGGYGYIYLNVRVNPAATIGSLLTNTAEIVTGDPETDYSDNTGVRVDTVVTPTWDLRITKSLYGTPLPGGALRYEIRINNTGPITANNVIITDTLPDFTTYVDWSSSSWSSNHTLFGRVIEATYTAATRQIVWPLGDVPPQSSATIYLYLNVDNAAPVRGVLCNLVLITSSNAETDLSNNVYTHTATIHMPLVDLSVSKSLNGQAGAPGGRMQYRIVASNNGNSPAADVVLTDTLPPSITLVSWSGGATTVTEVDGKLVWNLGEIAAGSSKYIYVTVYVEPSVEVGARVTNTVEVSTSSADVDRRDNTAMFGVTIAPPTRDVYVDKWLSSGTPVAGAEIVYGLGFGNRGNMTATNVILTDTLPGKVTYVSWRGYIYNPSRAAPDLLVQGNQLVWRLGEVLPDQYGRFYITVRVADDATPGEMLVNRAQIACAEPDAGTGDNEDEFSTDVVAPTRDVTVSKERYGVPGAPGGLLTYQIYFGNTGNSPAANVVITETLPPTLTYVSWSGSLNDPYYGDWHHLSSPTIGGGQIVWRIPELRPNQSGYIYLTTRVTDTALLGDSLANVVSISTSSSETGDLPNVYTHTETLTRTWDVAVSKELASGSVPLPGNEFEYMISVSNFGNSVASDVVVTDTWPVSVTYVSWSGYVNNPHRIYLCDEDVTLNVAGRQARWRLGALQPGARGYIYLRVRITGAGAGEELVNPVEITTPEAESDTANNVYTLTTTVLAPTRDMYISKSLRAAGLPGEQMRYSLYFKNQGNSPAADVVITDTLPPSVTFVAWVGYMYAPNYVNLNQAVSPIHGAGKVVWQLGTLPRNAYGYIYVIVRLADTARTGDLLVNRAEVSTADEESDYANNVSTNTHTVGGLTRYAYVYKYLDSPPAAAGSWMRYYIYVSNYGNYTTTNVILTDTLPLSTSLASWEGSLCRWNALTGWWHCYPLEITPVAGGGKVAWRLGDLPPDSWVSLYLTVRVENAAAVWQVMRNTAEITGDYGVSDYDYDETRVTLPWVDLYTSKYLSSDPAAPGGEMTYGIYIGNNGNVTATNVIVADDLPAGAEYVSWSGYLYEPSVDLDATITPTVTAGRVTWALGSLVPGQYGYIYLTVRLTEMLSLCDRLTNTVTVTSAGTDFYPDNNAAWLTTRVAQLIRLMGVTISGPTTGTVGTLYNFTATVTPPTATNPSYTWSSAGLVSGQGSASALYRWTTPGTYTITVVARNAASVVSDTHVIVISAAPCTPLTGVSIAGPSDGFINRNYTFNAVITPTDASWPITYTWSPAPSSGQGTEHAVYSWPTTGAKVITLRVENCGGVFTATHTINIVDPCPVPLTGVTISGPTYGYAGTDYTFRANPQPSNATPPITYTWSPAPNSGQGTANAVYNWDTPGQKTISVVASNCGGTDEDSHELTIAVVETITGTVSPTEGITLVYTDPQGLTTTVQIPAGAVTDVVEIRFTPVPSPTEPITGELRFANHAFDLDAYRGGVPIPGFAFERPVTITIHYSNADVAGIDESTLTLYYWDASSGVWRDAAETCPADYDRRPDLNRLALPICHLSRFGVMGYTAHYEIYLPLVMRNA